MQSLGWKASGFQYEVACSSGHADIVYQHNGKNIVVIEAKRVGGQQNHAIAQAKRYAHALNIPIAIATDGDTFLHGYHLKKNAPLLNHLGAEISVADFATLTISNILHFVKNPSLQSRVKTESELNAF